MEDVDPWVAAQGVRMRREQAVAGTTALFFVSGATALVYQTLWNRDLHLVFGTSSFAIATVLAAFMLGLALGGAVMARYADGISRPLRVYGVLEILIGLYAVLFPTLVGLVTPIYLDSWRLLQPGPVLFGVIQFLLVGSLLVLPTAAMGATLPLLARFATTALGEAGDRVGTLYSVNTAGAVAGTWMAGFVLLPGYGLWATTLMAAFANLALGGVALGLDHWYGAASDTVEVTNDLTSDDVPTVWPVAVVLGLAGFSSLVYEVAWTRLLGLMVGASVYAFSVMLLAFLVGIAVGGKLGGRLADRALRRYGQRGVLVGLGITELGVAGLSYLLMYVFPELPFWYVWLFDWMDAATDPTMMWATSLLIAGLVMTPPAVLMGIAFPVAVRAVIGDDERLGGPVGNVYAANTIGAVVGAFSAGFLLLPNIGVQGTIFTAAVVNVLAATVAFARAGGRAWTGGVGALAALAIAFFAARPPWDPLMMTSGMYHYVTAFEDHSREGIENYSRGLYDLVYYEEGLSTVVTVAENRKTENMWLANNGKVDASTTSDMPTQVLCSLLPMQFSKARDEVLVIGLASGITAGALTQLDDIGRMDVVELEPAIERAARLFGRFNHDVLDDPRVNLIANDGRNHLLIAPEGAYDVIVSEPSNPWITGVSNLFTKEFWEMGKTRLKPGGVWSQWVQMYGMDDRDLRTLLHTFSSVYPHVLLYATIEDADLVLIGSEEPLVADAAHARRLFETPKLRAQLAAVDVDDPYDLIAMFQMDGPDIVEATKRDPMNTDDNMRIEYNAPLNLHKDTHGENSRFLMRNVAVPDDAMVGFTPWRDLARAFERKGDSARAMLAYANAISLAPDDDSRVLAEVELNVILERIAKAASEPEAPDEAPESK